MRALYRLRKTIRWYIIDFKARLGISDAEALAKGMLPPYAVSDPQPLSIPLGDETFIARDALHGATATPELAAKVPHGFWVNTSEGSECIRIYSAGLGPGANPIVLVYLSGDVILRTNKGMRCVSETYTQQSPARLEAQMTEWAAEAEAPTVFLARPGTFGSSGDHEKRRQNLEISLVSGALDQLKMRHDIRRFILVGQSGGGQIAASLLARRDDLFAVVLTSSLLTVHKTVRFWRRTRPVPGGAQFPIEELHDPMTEIAMIPKEPAPAIWIISDPRDTVIPFHSQLQYIRALRAEGHRPEHIFAHAYGAKRHYLGDHGRRVASLVAQGKTAREIREALVLLDLVNLAPQKRKRPMRTAVKEK